MFSWYFLVPTLISYKRTWKLVYDPPPRKHKKTQKHQQHWVDVQGGVLKKITSDVQKPWKSMKNLRNRDLDLDWTYLLKISFENLHWLSPLKNSIGNLHWISPLKISIENLHWKSLSNWNSPLQSPFQSEISIARFLQRLPSSTLLLGGVTPLPPLGPRIPQNRRF